jgi:UDP-N-acetylmuramoyl-L-alanyl-D-glutamate--2,6-diaminopimelate ligase
MKRSLSFPLTYPVTCHTDHVGAGSTFVAINGYEQDGGLYIPTALHKGATTIVVAHDAILSDALLERMQTDGIVLERVENTRKALAQLSAQAAGNPAAQLTIIGVTGTKGKTTTSWIVYDILRSAQTSVALMSGVANKINGFEFEAPLTTAQPDYIHQFLKLCVENKVTHVVMEVAAQAVSLNRVDGIAFDVIALTNFGHEHLEFYATLEDYFAAKRGLINFLKPHGTLCLNNDDAWVRRALDEHVPLKTYSCLEDSGADVQLELRDDRDGISFEVRSNKRRSIMRAPHLMGIYNLYNCAAAITIAFALGIDAVVIAATLEEFQGVPGRLEWYTLANEARIVIDYAHTPDSYKALLSTLRNQTDDLTVIFGAGGKRDKSKRPIMGGIAATYADHIILTSDNPRNENPTTIVHDIMQGIDEKDHHKVTIQLDRERAITQAAAQAPKHAIIALLGKGNDEYQIVGDVKSYFSERDIIQQLV